MARPRGKPERDWTRTSLYIRRELLHRLKVAVAEEQIAEGVSGLLSRLAEEWLAKRKGGRR